MAGGTQCWRYRTLLTLALQFNIYFRDFHAVCSKKIVASASVQKEEKKQEGKEEEEVNEKVDEAFVNVASAVCTFSTWHVDTTQTNGHMH